MSSTCDVIYSRTRQVGIIICSLVTKIWPFIGSQERAYHCEDHNHLLKRIIVRLRKGLIPGIDLCYMREALHDPTGLTYEALTGKNKQSVPIVKGSYLQK